MHSRHDFTIYIFERHVRALHIYARRNIFSSKFENFGTGNSGHFEFSVFFSRDKCSCSGFDGGYNSEVETEPA